MKFQEIEEKRNRLLKKLWDKTQGSTAVEVNLPEIAREEGLTYDDAVEFYRHLIDKRWAEHISQAPSVRLTSRGGDAIGQHLDSLSN